MSLYIKLLTDISYASGLIGLTEFCERCAVAEWLMDSADRISDPRLIGSETEAPHPEPDYPTESGKISDGVSVSTLDDDETFFPELLVMDKWMFTIGDVDCYPSVPHGHYLSKTREWPKLNPYTGRVYSKMHREDNGKRLRKKEMKKIWNNVEFVDHCREQVIWYSNFAKGYGFPRARRGKLIFPKWR